MTFPTIPTSGAGRILSSANTSPAGTHTFPSLSSLTKSAGDLLIAICVTYDGNSTNAEFSSWGGGFTEFVDQATTTTMGIGCAYKFSDGTETGTFTVTTADTSTNDSVCMLLSIPGAHTSTPPEGGTITNGTSTAANIASFNPAGWDVEDTLWIAVCGSGETATTGSFTAPSAAPTNYGSLFASAVSADVVGGVYGAVAFRQLAAASDDPATFTVDTADTRNSALLLAVPPVPLVTDDPIGKSGVVAWYTDQSASDGSTTTTWVDSCGRGNDAANASSVITHQTGELFGLPVERGTGATNSWLRKSSAALAGMTSWTCAFVHKPTTVTGTADTVIAFGDVAGGGAEITVNASKLQVYPAAGSLASSSSTTLVGGTVYRHVVTCDSGGNVNVYVDGTLDTLSATARTFDYTTSPVILIGAITATPTEFYLGDLAEIVIYNSVVDSTERAALFTYLERWTTAGGDATATPAVIAATATVPATTENIAAGPGVIAATATLPASTENIGAGPAAIGAPATLPASNRNIGAGPAVIARAATLPQATGSAATDATATPAVVATASTVPASNRNIVAGPAALAGVTALPASARNVGAGPAIVATAASLPASNRNIGAGPAVIARAAAMPQATPVTTGNAIPTPAVIATLAALARPAVNVTVGVSAIQLAALISEGLGVDGSAGPAVLAAVAALPQVTVLAGGNATPTPAAITSVAALVRPAVNVAAGPTVTAALATLGQAIPQASVTKTPAVLAGVAALGQAIPQASVTTVPATLAALAALGGVGLSTGASPAVLGALAALVRPSVHVAAGPLVIARAATLPAPTVTAGGNVTVAPAAVAAVGALARAGVNVAAGPVVLAALSAVIRPLVNVGAGPAVIARAVAIGQAVALAGGGAAPSPATVAALASLAQPAVNVRAGPLVVPAVATIPQAQPGQAASKSPATIAAVVAFPAVGAGVGASPATILVVVAVPLVADVGGEPNPGYGIAYVGQVGAEAYVDQVGAGAYVDRKRGKVIVG